METIQLLLLGVTIGIVLRTLIPWRSDRERDYNHNTSIEAYASLSKKHGELEDNYVRALAQLESYKRSQELLEGEAMRLLKEAGEREISLLRNKNEEV